MNSTFNLRQYLSNNLLLNEATDPKAEQVIKFVMKRYGRTREEAITDLVTMEVLDPYGVYQFIGKTKMKGTSDEYVETVEDVIVYYFKRQGIEVVDNTEDTLPQEEPEEEPLQGPEGDRYSTPDDAEQTEVPMDALIDPQDRDIEREPMQQVGEPDLNPNAQQIDRSRYEDAVRKVVPQDSIGAENLIGKEVQIRVNQKLINAYDPEELETFSENEINAILEELYQETKQEVEQEMVSTLENSKEFDEMSEEEKQEAIERVTATPEDEQQAIQLAQDNVDRFFEQAEQSGVNISDTGDGELQDLDGDGDGEIDADGIFDWAETIIGGLAFGGMVGISGVASGVYPLIAIIIAILILILVLTARNSKLRENESLLEHKVKLILEEERQKEKAYKLALGLTKSFGTLLFINPMALADLSNKSLPYAQKALGDIRKQLEDADENNLQTLLAAAKNSFSEMNNSIAGEIDELLRGLGNKRKTKKALEKIKKDLNNLQ